MRYLIQLSVFASLFAVTALEFRLTHIAPHHRLYRRRLTVSPVLRTLCKWDCIIDDSANFGTEMRTLIGKYRLITVDLLLERRLENKCVNQTASFNSTRIADYWMWSTANFLNPDQNVTKQSGNVRRFSKSFEGRAQAKVSCSFKFSEDVAVNGTQSSLNDLIATTMIEEVQRHFISELSPSEAVLCYKDSAKNSSYVCVNASTNTPGNSSVGWPVTVLKTLFPLIWLMLVFFSPVVLCYFSPTKVYRNEEWMIVLSGPCSYVSIRGSIANLCSSKSSSTFGIHKTALLFLLILSALTIAALLYADDPIGLFRRREHFPSKLTDLVPQPRAYLMLCYCLWFLRFLVRTRFRQLSTKEPCIACYFCCGKKIIHQLNEPVQVIMRQHMQIQPLIVIKCYRLFPMLISCYLQKRRGILAWPWLCSYHGPIRSVPLFVLGLLLTLLVVVLSFVACLILIGVFVFYTCPMSAFCDALMFSHIELSKRLRSRRASLKAVYMVSALGVFQFWMWAEEFSFFTLLLANELITTVRTFVQTFPDDLPNLTLFIIFTWYYMTYYSWFTKQYSDIAVKIYNKLLKIHTKRGEKGPQVRERVIPKVLFDNVCEELLPLRNGLGMLAAQVVALTTFVVAVYAAITETSGMTGKATDFVTTFATILTGLVPFLVEMAREMGQPESREKLDQRDFDEKLESIVQEYDNFITARTDAQENTSVTSDNSNTGQEENERERLIGNNSEEVRSYGTFNSSSRQPRINHNSDNHRNTSQEGNERERLISNSTEQERRFGTFNRFSRLIIQQNNGDHNNFVV